MIPRKHTRDTVLRTVCLCGWLGFVVAPAGLPAALFEDDFEGYAAGATAVWDVGGGAVTQTAHGGGQLRGG